MMLPILIGLGLLALAARLMLRGSRDAEQERLERSWRRARNQGRP
jgi:hypothetical protein